MRCSKHGIVLCVLGMVLLITVGEVFSQEAQSSGSVVAPTNQANDKSRQSKSADAEIVLSTPTPQIKDASQVKKETTNNDDTRTKVEGAGLGALLGAGLGAIFGGREGAAIGGAIGGLIGTGIGSVISERKQEFVAKEDSLDKTIERTALSVNTATQYSAKLKAEIEASEKNIASLKTRLAENAADRDELEKSKVQIQQSIDEAQLKLAQYESDLSELVAAHNSAKEQLEAMITDQKAAKEKMASLDAKIVDYVSSIQSISRHKTVLLAQFNNLSNM